MSKLLAHSVVPLVAMLVFAAETSAATHPVVDVPGKLYPYEYFDGRMAPDRIDNAPRDLIYAAIENKQSEVTIPPGIYRMTPEAGTSAYISIDGVSDLTINAAGVIVLGEVLTRFLQIHHCKNLTIKGLTFDFSMNAFHFTQGTVIATGEDAGVPTIDIKIHDGYPVEAWSRIEIFDPETRFRKDGFPFMWGNRSEVIDKEVGIVRAKFKRLDFADVGDLVSLSSGYRKTGIPHTIMIGDSAGTSMSDVTLHSSISFGMYHNQGDGGGTFKRIRIVPGPRPVGASEDRLLSTMHDGWKIRGLKQGIVVEDCEITHNGDDAFSIDTRNYMVVHVDGTRAVILGKGIKQGEHVRLGINGTEVKVIDVQAQTNDSWDDIGVAIDPDLIARFEAAKHGYFKQSYTDSMAITFASQPEFSAGDKVEVREQQCDGYIFRNNTIHSSGRLLICAGSDGLIENNQFHGLHGINISPQEGSREANGMRTVTIRGNRLVHTAYNCPSPGGPGGGAISMCEHLDSHEIRDVPLFIDFTIEDNVIVETRGVTFNIMAAEGLTIRNNTIIRPGHVEPSDTGKRYGVNHGALLFLRNARNVVVDGNAVHSPGPWYQVDCDVQGCDDVSLERAFTVVDTPAE